MPADAGLLSQVPLFANLDATEIDLLASTVELRSLPPGEVLFRQGDPGRSMYVVAAGSVELSVTDTTGVKTVLHSALTGDVFGELALLDDGPRSATATAAEDTELLELSREDLLLVIRNRPETALHMLGAVGAMTRKADMLLRTRVAKNPELEFEEKLTNLQRLADAIARFSGSVEFLLLNALWFVVWIVLNVAGIWVFDPFPFGLLTMIVSLEAIFLSCFVLVAQDRQAAKDRVRSEVEYQVNVKAELEVAHLHEKVDQLREDLFRRLEGREPPAVRKLG